MQSFGFIPHFVLELLKWDIFDTRGHCDVTVVVKILKYVKIIIINEFLMQKLAKMHSFAFISHFVLELLKLGIFDIRGNGNVTVGEKILEIYQNHHYK